MQIRTKIFLTNLLKPRDRRNAWKWAESDDGIDFSRVISYDCSYKRPFSIALLPYWKEPLENITDRNCREQVVVKNTRAGGSMTLLETALRYSIAVDPKSTLYISGSKESCDSFFKLRICKGMNLSPICGQKYREAQVHDTVIEFPDMRFQATYPNNRMFGKQDSWQLILGDEVSAYFDADSIAALRTRQVTIPFPHLILISSPDTNSARNSIDDPIFIEYEKTDQREWFVKDPKSGKRFVFKMGSRKGNEPGLKINHDAKDKNGKWNLNIVRRDVYYLTPDGTKIYEKDRMNVIATGMWIPTVKDSSRIEPGRRGYHINAFLAPWISFGELATKWIEACETSKSEVRSFIFNYLAEPYWESKTELKGNEIIYERTGNYNKGDKLLEIDEYKSRYNKIIEEYNIKNKDNPKANKNPVLVVSGDVQKTSLYALARLWFSNGDNFLMDWKNVPTFTDFVEWVNQIKPSYACIDSNYQDRKAETTDYCFKNRMIAMIGSKNTLKNKIDVTQIDPYSGTKYAGKKKINQIMYDASFFKDILFEELNNTRFNKFYIYKKIENEYVNQLNSERKVDGKWTELKKSNHILDCEVQQLVIAYHLGILNPSIGDK